MRQIAVCLILFCLAAPAAAETPTLTVTGEGRAEAAPDMATVTLGVTHEAETAKDAMDRVSADLGAVLATLRAAGIEERDLQTAGLRLSPVWTSYDSRQTRRITGFRATNTVSARVRALDGLGNVLDAVLAEGANTFQGISFGLQEPTPVLDAARRAAVADAQRKAALYAKAAGVTLGPLQSLGELGAAAPRPMVMEAARMASDAVPVAPGEMTLSAQVTMVFALEE